MILLLIMQQQDDTKTDPSMSVNQSPRKTLNQLAHYASSFSTFPLKENKMKRKGNTLAPSPPSLPFRSYIR